MTNDARDGIIWDGFLKGRHVRLLQEQPDSGINLEVIEVYSGEPYWRRVNTLRPYVPEDIQDDDGLEGWVIEALLVALRDARKKP